MFSDADLIGIPNKLIIGKKLFQDGNLEFKNRRLDKTSTIKESQNSVEPSKSTLNEINRLING